MNVNELIAFGNEIFNDQPKGLITDEDAGRPFKMRVGLRYENGKGQFTSGICLATIFENMHHNNRGHECYNVPINEWKYFVFNGKKDFLERGARVNLSTWIEECKEHGFLKYVNITQNQFGATMAWNKQKLPDLSVAEWYSELQMLRWCREWDSIPYFTLKAHEKGVDFLQALIAATLWNACRFCHNFIMGTGAYDLNGGIAKAIQAGAMIHNVMNGNKKDDRLLWDTYENHYHYYQVFYNSDHGFLDNMTGIKSNKDGYAQNVEQRNELGSFMMHPYIAKMIHNDDFNEAKKQIAEFAKSFQSEIDAYYKEVGANA